jgi:UPF0755 protein
MKLSLFFKAGGLLLLLLGAFIAWRIFGPNTSFTEDKKAIYIQPGSSMGRVEMELEKAGIVKNNRSFSKLARWFGYHKNILPGRYVFKKGTSIYAVWKTLKSGRQTPVNFTITKLRTPQDLARKISSSFNITEQHALQFVSSNDSLRSYGLDSHTVLTVVMPNTYSIYWTTPISTIFEKLQAEQQKFWTAARKQLAAAHNLTTAKAYILASIVEEETNMPADKGKIASVYLNRLETGMRLGADPTVKYALKDFSLKRIYHKHLTVQSPYNTYQVSGLPPGPICTPSYQTIDAVLNAPATSYLYFVAKPDFSGYSNFAITYDEHLQYAKAYQQALNEWQKKKAITANTP